MVRYLILTTYLFVVLLTLSSVSLLSSRCLFLVTRFYICEYTTIITLYCIKLVIFTMNFKVFELCIRYTLVPPYQLCPFFQIFLSQSITQFSFQASSMDNMLFVVFLIHHSIKIGSSKCWNYLRQLQLKLYLAMGFNLLSHIFGNSS